MEPLIYIEQREKDEASLLLKGLTNPNQRKRVFINALGAELLMKYLAQEGINVANIYNMHSIFRIREEFDIADVMLPNIYIDVRVVYDQNLIFVPKSHFENNLVPDVYVVFQMAQDSTHVDFLGFIKPENIDKSKQNPDYYFIEKDQLIHPFEFIEFVKNFEGNTTESFSEDLYNDVLSLIDNDINDEKKHELINSLRKSSALREEMIEFDNFEWLSYNVSKEEIIEEEVPEMSVVDEFDLFEQKDDFGFDENEENQGEQPEDSSGEVEFLDPQIDDSAKEEEIPSAAEILAAVSGTERVTVELSDVVGDFPETEDVTTDLSTEVEELPVVEDIAPDLSAEAEELSGDLELNEPGDLSIDFDNEEGLQIEELTEITEPEMSEDIVQDEVTAEEPLELLDKPEDLNIENSDVPLDNVLDTGDEPAGELVELTEVTDLSEEVNESENIEIQTETDEKPQELVDLVPLDSEAIAAEEISNNEEVLAEEPLQDLVPLEELNSETDDSDKDITSESTEEPFEIIDEPVELEAYNNASAEDSEEFEIIHHEEPEEDISPIESFENTTVISSDNDEPGEIAIDINSSEPEDLEVLYNATSGTDVGTDATKAPEKGKKAVLVAAATAAAVVIAASATYFVMNNNKPSDVTDTPIAEGQEPPAEEQPVPVEETIIQETPTETTIIETKPAPVQPQPIESAYIDIKRMGWSVPDYVTYNDGFKHYLQTLGKSIKLALSSDLLLATEYPYSDQINVDLILWNSGWVKDIKISKSSGSAQIDGIVLQTVKETVNAVKPPAGVIVGDRFHMTLKIYL